MKTYLLPALLLLASCNRHEAPKAPPPTTVSVAHPVVRQVVDWDDYVGRFEALQDVEVRARATGVVTRVYFRNGQDVRAGQPLFEIDPRPYRAALAQALAQATRARASLTNARQIEQRTQSLLGEQAVSREEFETNQATTRTAAADLAAAEANVRTAKLNLDFTTTRAPFAGRASDRRVNVGDAVTDGTTVMTRVVSLDPIWFTFEAAESFYLKNLRQDARGERGSSRYHANPIDIQLADESAYRWRGSMSFVDNAVDPQSGTIRAKAQVSNPTHFLTPGMFGRARLLGSGSYEAMLVPDEAIVADQARRTAYVLTKDGKVAVRPVETGPLVEGLRVVKAGLAPTDYVVLDGLTRLQPGAPVKARRTQIKPRAADEAPTATPLIAPPSSEATAAGSAR